MFGEVKIYIGTIIEAKGNQVKVDILGTQTDFMTYVTGFNAFNQHCIPPVLGESVMVISFLNSNSYLALSLPSCNTSNPSDTESITYNDGTKISYNTNTHTLKIDSKASINITAKNANIKAESINLGNEGGSGVVTSQCICPFTGSPHQGSTKVKAIL
ncbi:hypothetical protein BKH42_06960 [Helicobacter sp. 13S00482-2]|uniref:phage baseplate assembly protein V n=1 Tax=Helicobacter sp. 13S00482-2 TaxID=1476200 RepID=UPI000BA7B05E|nr:phage baseplate assembly protein V [Helicobacter sp. 13S00482-2]PAF53260.1 hypothetical protein BKH42_06960 [Helicobacter sp. 13S00482-2]